MGYTSQSYGEYTLKEIQKIASIDIIKAVQNFSDYFSNHASTDDFGWSPAWNDEISQWLELVSKISPTRYKIYKNRAKTLRSDEHREALIGEIKTIYFIAQKMGFKVVDLEPEGKHNTKLDLSFEDLDRKLWKVEVKSPTWRGQVWKNSALTVAEKEARVLQPKIRNGKFASISLADEMEDALEHSIKNALPKFVKGDNNLLVITPDLFQDVLVMMAFSAMKGDSSQIKGLIRMHDEKEIISSVLILEPTLPISENEVWYAHKFIALGKLPKLPFMAEVV